jgi:3-deoxy-D-manno-octulosonic-acid transferase
MAAGNLKYDLNPAGGSAFADWLEAELGRTSLGPLLVAGSAVAGEEAAVLEAFAMVAEKWPRALLLLAPRKPERFEEALAIVQKAGWRAIRRSALSLGGESASIPREAPGQRGGVLLLDSLGELAAIYRLADTVFIGGSLVPMGGHNPLESAAYGKAPVFGPSMENFREIAAELLGAGAALEVRSGAELGAAWIALLADDQRRAQMGRAAQELVECHRGATAAAVEHLSGLMEAPQVVR